MRILYLLPFIPWPVRVRSSNFLPRLAERHQIDLVCVGTNSPHEPTLRILREKCSSVHLLGHSRTRAMLGALSVLPGRTPMRMGYCRSPRVQQQVRRIIAERRPDLVYLERWRTLSYLPADCRLPLVCDPTDSMTLYNRRLRDAGVWWERIVGGVEYARFLDYEAALARRADATIFCSRLDLETVRERAAEANLVLVPNGVDTRRFFRKQAREESADTIVFTGNFDYAPNRHACQFFLNEVFPRIREAVPQARFVVVGNGADRRLPHGQSGVELHGFVPDVREYVARAAVAVAPITLGTGVSNKLLEAFSTGTAVVSTRIAAGDLPIADGEHLFLADDAPTFASRVVELLRDPSLRAHMAENGRRLVESAYDWEIITARLEDCMHDVLARNAEDAHVQAAMASSRSTG